MPHECQAFTDTVSIHILGGRKNHVTLVLVFAALCEYYILLTARFDKGQGDIAIAVDNVKFKGLGGLLLAGPKHLLKVIN